MARKTDTIQMVLNPRQYELLDKLTEKLHTNKTDVLTECIKRAIENYGKQQTANYPSNSDAQKAIEASIGRNQQDYDRASFG